MEDLDGKQPLSKRRKVGESETELSLPSLMRPVSPPSSKNRRSLPDVSTAPQSQSQNSSCETVSSPFKLNRIEGLPNRKNGDTVTLHNLLGDPLIKECWQFNYLFDVDFLMRHFDEDVRSLVQVKIVHGSWKKEDLRRQNLEEASKKYPNIQLIVAYMPEPFGTHHTKMMVLFRHDETAEIVIHTANMIELDWTLMSQAVWRSPRLPLLQSSNKDQIHEEASQMHPIGTGKRFKIDFLRYLDAYGKHRTGSLVDALQTYDFDQIHAALIASVPSKQPLVDRARPLHTSWGWPGLREVLRSIPPASGETATIVIQISSIASLSEAWVFSFMEVLRSANSSDRSKADGVRIIFPTPDEIRRSVGGYRSGSSIHMKIQSAQQAKQLSYLRPYLCHWAGDSPQNYPSSGEPSRAKVREAGRRRAAPHIKTFIRFTSASMESIDWAMVTSANLSKQAWGELANTKGEVRICSWELGVIVWPDLFQPDKEEGGTWMVPSFMQDMPAHETLLGKRTVGIRMPYDLPLQPYGYDEVPWCATAVHLEPDWKGQTWTA